MNTYFLNLQTSISLRFVHLSVSLMNNLAYKDNPGLARYSPKEERSHHVFHSVSASRLRFFLLGNQQPPTALTDEQFLFLVHRTINWVSVHQGSMWLNWNCIPCYWIWTRISTIFVDMDQLLLSNIKTMEGFEKSGWWMIPSFFPFWALPICLVWGRLNLFANSNLLPSFPRRRGITKVGERPLEEAISCISGKTVKKL